MLNIFCGGISLIKGMEGVNFVAGVIFFVVSKVFIYAHVFERCAVADVRGQLSDLT